jgi:TPR repeat protein
LGYYYEYGFGRLKKNYNYAYSLYSYACKKECKLGCENLKKFNAWLIEMNLTAREIPLNEIIE